MASSNVKAPRDAFCQRLAFDELHDQELPPFRFLEAVKRRDIGMAQPSKELGLSFESGETLLVLRERVAEDFDGHVTVELRIPSPIDFPHAARTKTGDDLVRAEAGACVQGHGPFQRSRDHNRSRRSFASAPSSTLR